MKKNWVFTLTLAGLFSSSCWAACPAPVEVSVTGHDTTNLKLIMKDQHTAAPPYFSYNIVTDLSAIPEGVKFWKVSISRTSLRSRKFTCFYFPYFRDGSSTYARAFAIYLDTSLPLMGLTQRSWTAPPNQLAVGSQAWCVSIDQSGVSQDCNFELDRK